MRNNVQQKPPRPYSAPGDMHSPNAQQQAFAVAVAHRERMKREQQPMGVQQQMTAGPAGNDQASTNEGDGPRGGTTEFWREYTLDLHSKGSYIPRHLRKYLPAATESGAMAPAEPRR